MALSLTLHLPLPSHLPCQGHLTIYCHLSCLATATPPNLPFPPHLPCHCYPTCLATAILPALTQPPYLICHRHLTCLATAISPRGFVTQYFAVKSFHACWLTFAPQVSEHAHKWYCLQTLPTCWQVIKFVQTINYLYLILPFIIWYTMHCAVVITN